jgi:L-serine dehydratase
MKQYPSIFNDVIGPVMIGPSSSHTAASVRIGRLLRAISGGRPRSVIFTFDEKSSVAATYHTQTSDRGLLAGLLGYETHSAEIRDIFTLAENAGLKYSFEVKDIGPGHPNAYFIELNGDAAEPAVKLTILSVGGGMIEMTDFMGFALSIDGGFFETLILCEAQAEESISARIKTVIGRPHIMQTHHRDRDNKVLIQVETESPVDPKPLRDSHECEALWQTDPVLPVMNQLSPEVPFDTARGILQAEGLQTETSPLSFCAKSQNPHQELQPETEKPQSLWQLAARYESVRGEISEKEVLNKMCDIVALLRRSIETPLPEDIPGRILSNQAGLLDGRTLLGGDFSKSVLQNVTRFMDIKTSMGVFVAAPTAGSCAGLPGTLFALEQEQKRERERDPDQKQNSDDETLAKALLSAGIVGVLIARHSTFAAEVCGCQAECGAGSGMCAAACAEFMGANAETALAAASMGLQNIFGMVCDPVANRVEVPCLGKNVMSAFNAIMSANMAVSGFAEVVPLDETIAAMDQVGRMIPRELRCTGEAGLSQAPTALQLKAERE